MVSSPKMAEVKEIFELELSCIDADALILYSKFPSQKVITYREIGHSNVHVS